MNVPDRRPRVPERQHKNSHIYLILDIQKTTSMNPNKALWEKGDFTRIAQSMRESGSSLVAQLGITKGMNVLDLGCGDGTTAIPEAKLGAKVLGVDIAQNLVAAGNARAQAEGLSNCTFQEGDATDLKDLEDGQFERVGEERCRRGRGAR